MEQGETDAERLEAAYQALPPLGTPEYMAYLGSVSARPIPPEVLARAYRELRRAKQDDAAEYTLQYLLRLEDECSGLRQLLPEVRRRHVDRRRDVPVEDLLVATADQIVRALHTDRGEFATKNWRVFGWQRIVDACRETYGRTGTNTDTGRLEVDPTSDEDVWSESPLFDGIARSDEPESDLRTRLLEFIDEQLEHWTDPTEREVLMNRLSPDPLPISSKEVGRPTLASRLGMKRDEVNRADRRARTKLKAIILASGQFTMKELRQMYPEAEKQRTRS